MRGTRAPSPPGCSCAPRLPGTQGRAKLPQTDALERDREEEDDDDDSERHDRIRPVEQHRDDEHGRGGRKSLPRYFPNDTEAHQREPEEEDRDPEPERPAARLRERVERVLERLLRRDG